MWLGCELFLKFSLSDQIPLSGAELLAQHRSNLRGKSPDTQRKSPPEQQVDKGAPKDLVLMGASRLLFHSPAPGDGMRMRNSQEPPPAAFGAETPIFTPSQSSSKTLWEAPGEELWCVTGIISLAPVLAARSHSQECKPKEGGICTHRCAERGSKPQTRTRGADDAEFGPDIAATHL